MFGCLIVVEYANAPSVIPTVILYHPTASEGFALYISHFYWTGMTTVNKKNGGDVRKPHRKDLENSIISYIFH